MLSGNLKLVIGLAASAGILQQAVHVRCVGVGEIGFSFVGLLILYLVAVFMVCLRPFSPIGIDSGKFSFDAACANMGFAPAADRLRDWK